MNVSAIVLAAGSGSRLGVPKQFLELGPGVRLVDAAVEAALSITRDVILVLPERHIWDGPRVAAIEVGGATRLESVAAGLRAISPTADFVVVHDAAHPLATKSDFDRVIEAVSNGADAAVPVLRVSEVVKRFDSPSGVTTLGRNGLGLAQVPMAFQRDALVAAHGRHDLAACWEDSMLVERNGGSVVAVPGSSWNVHVVSDEDLAMVRALFRELRVATKTPP